jgi:hypothetical protein
MNCFFQGTQIVIMFHDIDNALIYPVSRFGVQNYRELDRGTNYFRAKILEVWEQTSVHGPMGREAWIQKVLWASVCYRLVNKIATFEVGRFFLSISNDGFGVCSFDPFLFAY